MPHTPGHVSDSEFVVGCPVFTRDGEKLGEVKAVRAGAFQVNASMQPDYWLSTSQVATCAADRVAVAFDKDRLGDYKLDAPEATATGATTTYTTSDRPR